METIKVTVNTKERLAIHLLDNLQGSLKLLSDTNYNKLKNEILKDGFSFVVHVYEDNESAKIYIIDGHQRIETLRKMKIEGYIIPEIPIAFVQADNLDHAKRKVLAAASQYGSLNQNGAGRVLRSIADMDLNFLNDNISMPSLNFEKMDFSLSDDISVSSHMRSRDIKNTSAELNEEDFNNFSHKCPKCNFEWD